MIKMLESIGTVHTHTHTHTHTSSLIDMKLEAFLLCFICDIYGR